MRATSVLAGILALFVAVVLALETILPFSGADAGLAGILAFLFAFLGAVALWDAFVGDFGDVWDKDEGLAYLKGLGGPKSDSKGLF